MEITRNRGDAKDQQEVVERVERPPQKSGVKRMPLLRRERPEV
jgi:hypothetical protein